MNRVPRILVIEDEAHIARLLQYVLSRNGFDVEVAHTGAAGLHSLSRRTPDAVLLDLHLPDMTGTEVLSSLRGRPECQNAAVIILSAHTFEYGLDTAISDGRTVQCPKPVAPSKLLDCLAEFGLAAPVSLEAH